MGQVALGALAATTASVLFSAGLLLQSLEASSIPREHALRLSLIKRLVFRKRWLEGCLTMAVGFGFHVTALSLAPLSVVQPALTVGLVVLLVYESTHGASRIRVTEGVAVLAIGLGIVGETVAASQSDALSTHPPSLILALGPLAAVALAPYLRGLLPRADACSGGTWAMFGAGAAYALTGLTTKLLSDRVAASDWSGVALWATLTAIAAGLALLDQTTALQRLAATRVGAVIYVTPVVVPVIVAGALLGARWPSSTPSAVVLWVAIAAICSGAAFLSASREIVT